MRRWSRCSKKDRKVSRISSEDMLRSPEDCMNAAPVSEPRSCRGRPPGRRPSGTRAGPAPTPWTGSSSATSALVRARAAARRGRGTGAARRGSAARRGRRARRRGSSARRATSTRCDRQLLARADDDAVGARVRREHVQRLARPRARARGAGRPCRRCARDGGRATRRRCRRRRPRGRPMRRRGARGTRARSCRPGSTGPASRACRATDSPAAPASSRTSGLRSAAEREAQARQRRGRERAEHVALVLGRVGGGAQQRPSPSSCHARVVAGGQRRARRARSASASIASRRT